MQAHECRNEAANHVVPPAARHLLRYLWFDTFVLGRVDDALAQQSSTHRAGSRSKFVGSLRVMPRLAALGARAEFMSRVEACSKRNKTYRLPRPVARVTVSHKPYGKKSDNTRARSHLPLHFNCWLCYGTVSCRTYPAFLVAAYHGALCGMLLRASQQGTNHPLGHKRQKTSEVRAFRQPRRCDKMAHAQ